MKVDLELNQREIRLLQISLWERRRSIKRKRSWRPSEQAAALAEVRMMERKLETAIGGPLPLEGATEAPTEAQASAPE